MKGFSAVTAEAIQAEAVKKELVDVKASPIANQARELMRAAVEVAGKNTEEAKALATTDPGQANRLSFAMAIVMMLSLVGSVIFTFVGVSGR